MAKTRTLLACTACGRPTDRWTGRCAACGAWGSIEEHPAAALSGAAPGRVPGGAPAVVLPLEGGADDDRRVRTGFAGVDRVLGGGIVPGSVILLAGEPGIGKSTLLLHLVANLSLSGLSCLLASGEESRAQVGARARRLGLAGAGIRYAPGRDLASLLAVAALERPDVLVIDSIQTVRDQDLAGVAGGPSQVRACADALVGLAKEQGTAVIAVGHVTKDGDVAGPRTLEHAVDAVISFEGDARSGLRVLASGKNRFGAEGEVAWFEMGSEGLAEVDPADRLRASVGEPGAAVALPLAGRRAVAVEIQALYVKTEGPPRRQVAGLDLRRFGLVAAVLDRAGIPVGRGELYGAACGGLLVDDPGADLAVAAALASSRVGAPPPPATAFVGEVSLTGAVRPVPGLAQRLAAAAATGIRHVVGPPGDGGFGGVARPGEGRARPRPASEPPTGGGDRSGVELVPVRHLRDAVGWARRARASEPEPAGQAGVRRVGG